VGVGNQIWYVSEIINLAQQQPWGKLE